MKKQLTYAAPEPPYFVEAIGGSDGTNTWSNVPQTLSTEEAVSFFIPMLPALYHSPTWKYTYYKDDFWGDSTYTQTYTGVWLKVVCGKITKLEELNLALN